MESTDSQLSLILKEGRVVSQSQEASENRTFDEFSQNTRMEIEAGNFLLPDLSQGGIDILEKDTKEMEAVRKSIEASPLDDNLNEYDYNLSADGVRQPELKRTRTNRIIDVAFSSLVQSGKGKGKNYGAESPNPNKSQDLFNSSLMDTSYDSMMTFTQTRIDSQSPILYLRNRTEEEQQKHKIEKQIKRESEEFVQKIEYEAPPQLAKEFHMGEKDVFADDDMEEWPPEKKDWTPIRSRCDSTKEFLKVEVSEMRTKKISEFVSTTIDEDTFLWAKIDCCVPIEISWRLNPNRGKQAFTLKARLVHYDADTPLEDALRSPWSDVRKCRDHTDHESVGFPVESFFYFENSSVEWTHSIQQNKLAKGHFFEAILPSGQNRISCDLKFRCQEKCFDLLDKRKTMCFVMFLDDEKGNALYTSLFREVRVVAYPRRDFKNFQEKLGIKVPKKQNFTFHPGPVKQEMFDSNANHKMFPTLTSNRKRAASEFQPMTSSSSAFSTFSTPQLPPRSNDYERQMMLGGSYRPPQPSEPMDIFHFRDENQMKAPKRERISTSSSRFHNIDITDEELEVLASHARAARTEAARGMHFRVPPLMAQCKTKPEMSIEEWLNGIGQTPYLPNFQRNGIQNVSDLIEAFNCDKGVFENIGIESYQIKFFRDVFLNFYRIFDAERRLRPV